MDDFSSNDTTLGDALPHLKEKVDCSILSK